MIVSSHTDVNGELVISGINAITQEEIFSVTVKKRHTQNTKSKETDFARLSANASIAVDEELLLK